MRIYEKRITFRRFNPEFGILHFYFTPGRKVAAASCRWFKRL